MEAKYFDRLYKGDPVHKSIGRVWRDDLSRYLMSRLIVSVESRFANNYFHESRNFV